MTIYWMLNNHWPSFFGHLFDYYLRPGGAYFGAKKGLRPLSVVFDSYATGDHDQANITVVNQTPGRPDGSAGPRAGVRPAGQGARRPQRRQHQRGIRRSGAGHDIAPNRQGLKCFLRPLPSCSTGQAKSSPKTSTGSRSNSTTSAIRATTAAFELKQASWADMTALNYMPQVPLQVSAHRIARRRATIASTIRLHNPSQRVAFFERAELTSAPRRRRDPADRVQRQLRDRVPRRDGRRSKAWFRHRAWPPIG